MRHRAVGLPRPQGRGRHRDLRGARDPTHVAHLRVDLHIPSSHSLKEKRAVVKPILDGARRRFQVAAAEVGYQEKWQRASLGFAVVGADHGHLTEVLQSVERLVWSFPEVEVLGAVVGYSEPDEDA